MPTRLLREGILTSERVDLLDFPGEVFYRRLMSKVDDLGLYDARPSILRASLYPLKVDRVREADISRWIAACEKAGLIALYAHTKRTESSRWIAACEMAGLIASEKPYLKMLDTRWQVRSEAKFPIPPANICKQLETVVTVVEDVVVVEDEVNPIAPGDKSPSHAGAVNGNAIAYIPIVGGDEWGVSKDLLVELEAAYPQVDGPQTLKEIRAWCITNPQKRKTARGVPRFLNRWFERVQNHG
jgi:hypothetical protein